MSVPDSAINYIVNNFLLAGRKEGVPIVVGISPQTVETVLELFFHWAEQSGFSIPSPKEA